MIELQALPAPAIVETLDYEAILAACKADFAARMREHLPTIDDILALESDPIVKLLEAHAYRELLFRARVNDAARAHLLAFASAGDLDQLAALFGVARLPQENDTRLRQRLQLRIAALGAQGTREHYEYHALTASPLVASVRASQPQPGSVLVMLWLTDQQQAETARLAVVAALGADAVRMLGITLTVAVAQPRPIDISARITRTRAAPADLMVQLAQRLQDAFAALATSGDSIARSWITSVLQVTGVHAVQWPGNDTPAELTTIAIGEYPKLGSVQLIDAGAVQ